MIRNLSYDFTSYSGAILGGGGGGGGAVTHMVQWEYSMIKWSGPREQHLLVDSAASAILVMVKLW